MKNLSNFLFSGILVSFLVSVLAGIVTYYICKWLDDDDEK